MQLYHMAVKWLLVFLSYTAGIYFYFLLEYTYMSCESFYVYMIYNNKILKMVIIFWVILLF